MEQYVLESDVGRCADQVVAKAREYLVCTVVGYM